MKEHEHRTSHELQPDNVFIETSQSASSEDTAGHWEVRNPDKQYLTHVSHIGCVAARMTDAHPDGWRFVVDRTDSRGKAGHFEYFVPDSDTRT